MNRRSRRAKRPPARLDAGGDDAAVQLAMRISMKQQRRVTHSITYAPTFTPTEEEFKEPLAYIRKIAPHGVASGIVKIVPPAGWKPEFNINVTKRFETYRQALHLLQEGESFDTGQIFNQEQYQSYANKFQEDWFAEHPEVAKEFKECMASGDNEAAVELLEKEYWNIVERVSPAEVFVDYANNMDTKKYGTPFGNSQVDRPWDLTTLINDKESILSKVGDRIAGVTTPWLYFGCMFATFCWHVEDHFLYSLNYMHNGAGKIWYGIPESCAVKFETLLRTTFPDRFKRDPDLMHQLITMVSPSFLLDQGITVYKSIQHTGDIIVTFPRGYHGGFSFGWNCAEAVNFALLDWLPVGRKAIESYQHPQAGRDPTFSHDKLLWDICQDVIGKTSCKSSLQIKMGRSELMILWRELEYVINREKKFRSLLRKFKVAETRVSKQWDGDPFQCHICRNMHFFAFCVCPCGTKQAKTVCLEHALDRHCRCERRKKVLCLQVSDKELAEALALLKKKLEELDRMVAMGGCKNENRISSIQGCGHMVTSTNPKGDKEEQEEKSRQVLRKRDATESEVCTLDVEMVCQGFSLNDGEAWGIGDAGVGLGSAVGRKMRLMQVDRVKKRKSSDT